MPLDSPQPVDQPFRRDAAFAPDGGHAFERAHGTASALLDRVRTTARLIAVIATLLLAAPHHVLGDDAKAVVTEAGEVQGTAVLVRREDRTNDATLYFLMSSRLFLSADGERRLATKTVQVQLDETRSLDVTREDVTLTSGGFVDLAILRATTSKTDFPIPKPVVYDPPSIGAVFLVSGVDGRGGATSIAEHVRFESTLLLIGDRDASGLAGCLGAPAISPDGVFGIVRECEPHRPPVVSLLPMARESLERYLPRQTVSVVPTPQFGLVERRVDSPVPLTACTATATAEMDVPFNLGPRETVTDATATLVNPHEVRLIDVTVLRLDDRSVHLGFTLGGSATPPAPPMDCAHGQALVTLHLRLAVTPNP